MNKDNFETIIKIANNIDNADLPEDEFLKQTVKYLFEREFSSRFSEEEILSKIDEKDYNLKYFTYFKCIEDRNVKYQIFIVNYDSEDKNIVLIDNEGFDSFVSALNQMHRIVDSIK